MSKSRKKIDKSQRSLFELLSPAKANPTEGSHKVIEELRAAMRMAIKHCPLSRHQIAGEMSHLLGETISKEMIDSWTRESDEINGRAVRHIPAEYLPAFCEATGCFDPLIVLVRRTGLFVVKGTEALRADIQRLDERIKGDQARKREQAATLKAIKGMGV